MIFEWHIHFWVKDPFHFMKAYILTSLGMFSLVKFTLNSSHVTSVNCTAYTQTLSYIT